MTLPQGWAASCTSATARLRRPSLWGWSGTARRSFKLEAQRHAEPSWFWLTTSCPSRGQFQGIIANPPYAKAHRLGYGPEGTWQAFEERFGTPLDRLTNLYALFLLKIWQDLAPGGRGAVLLPAEFLNANFGEEIKDRLLKEMRPPGLVVFAPTLNLFEDALTTSAIVFLQKDRSASEPMVAVRGDSLEAAAAFVDYILGMKGDVAPAEYL